MLKRPGAVTRSGSSRLWMVVAAFGIVWAILQGFGLLGPVGIVTMVVGAVVAVAATVYGIRRWKPVPVWPWRAVLVALGLFAFDLGLRVALAGDNPAVGAERSIIPDLFALPAYIVLAIGVAGLAGVGKGDRDDLDAVLDACIAALSVLAVLWVFVIVPFLAKGGATLTAEIQLVA
jgi:hypothetical protein